MPDFEQTLEMRVLDWEIFQAASEGLEYARPKLRDVRFTFYDSKLMPYFFDWAKSSNSKRSGKIEYISSDMGKVEYSFSFEDAVCSVCNLHFIENEELPLFCEVSLSVSLQKQDLVKGKGEKAKKIVAAPIEGETVNTVNEDTEPVLTKTAWTDENEKSIKESEDENIAIKLNVTNIAQNKVVNIKLKHEDSETGDISYSIAKGIVNADGTITLKK